MPRPNVSQERKRQIMQAAAVTFSRLGFPNTRMEDVAEEAQLSKGTLYLYFASKEALLEELLHYLFIPLNTALEALERPGETATQRILNYSSKVLNEFEQMRILYPLIFEFFALATRQKNVQLVIEEYFQTYRSALVAILQEGIDSGELETRDPVMLATALIASIEGSLQLAATVPNMMSLQQYGSQVVHLLVAAIRKT